MMRSGSTGSAERARLGAALLLVAITAAIYSPTLGYGFIWDDHEQVVDNPYLRDWTNAGRFWIEDTLSSYGREAGARSSYYRPLFLTHNLVWYQLFGLRSAAWHAAAIAHHVLATLAAWLLLRRLGLGRAMSWSAALLFGVHPAHGESVTWIAPGLYEIPAATLTMLALAAHVTWIHRRRWWYLGLSGASYAAALCFKESALALLLLVPVVEGYVRREVPLRRLLPAPAVAWAWIGLLVAFELLTPWGAHHPHATWVAHMVSLGALLAVAAWRRTSPGGGVFAASFQAWAVYLALTGTYFWIRKLTVFSLFGTSETPLAEALPTLPSVVTAYLRLLVWPVGLGPSYPLRLAPGWSASEVWIPAAGLAVGALLVARLVRRRPLLAFAALWTLFSLAPALNVSAFRPYFLVHQRYAYLAVLGVAVALAWFAVERIRTAALRRGLLALWVVIGIASNLYHNRFWADDEVLWSRIAAMDPGNPAAFNWLGRKAVDDGDLEQAEKRFRGAIAAEPDSPFGHCNLAMLYHTRRGQSARAIAVYERGLEAHARWEPPAPGPWSECLVSYGAALAAEGRQEQALRAFVEATKRPPHPIAAFRNAAVLLMRSGRMPDVERVLMEGLRHHPDDRDLGTLLLDVRQGRIPAPRPHP